jgi:hypothetical protein
MKHQHNMTNAVDHHSNGKLDKILMYENKPA